MRVHCTFQFVILTSRKALIVFSPLNTEGAIENHSFTNCMTDRLCV